MKLLKLQIFSKKKKNIKIDILNEKIKTIKITNVSGTSLGIDMFRLKRTIDTIVNQNR